MYIYIYISVFTDPEGTSKQIGIRLAGKHQILGLVYSLAIQT